MEGALIRGRARHPAVLGDAVLVGPHTHINGARVEDETFSRPARRCSPARSRATGARCGSTPSCTSTPGSCPTPRCRTSTRICAVQRELDFPARSMGLNAAHRCATSWLGRSTSMAHTATTHSSPDHPFHTPGNQGGRSPRHTARRHHPSLGRTRRQPGRHPRRPRPRGPLPGHDRDLTFSAATDQAAAGGDRRSVIGLTR